MSRAILTKNFTDLMRSGTSGLSNAWVEVDMAVSIADERVENAKSRIVGQRFPPH